MYAIDHSSAIELEQQVRNLFKCDRFGVSGLADADKFEAHPLDAAAMVVSYIHAKGLQDSENQYIEFLNKYNTVFTYPEEYDMKLEIKNYIKELTEIVKKYL